VTGGERAAAGQFAAVSVVRDGDGYVLGRLGAPDFVAVPEIGGLVVRWLQDGTSVSECARRAAELAGEPVDVAGFLDGLRQAGLLASADGPPAEDGPPAGVAPWQAAAGRAAFGPAGLAWQGLLAAAAVAVLTCFPHARPGYADAITTGAPLPSVVILAVLATCLGLAHELAHVLAAWAANVPSRVSISRRMIFVVYQTDLTQLWTVPRRSRVVPLLAGLLFDGAATGILAMAELMVPGSAPPLVVHLIRAAVFLNVGAIAFQFLIFLRTDVYALFVLATGCRNLWDTKGALARRAIGRATMADLAVLAAAGPREIRWARVFLGLYAPGVLLTTWYFAVFAVPATQKIARASISELISSGPWSLAGAAAGTALTITAASAAFVLAGLARSLARIIRQAHAANGR
jgi:hypothetical protein